MEYGQEDIGNDYTFLTTDVENADTPFKTEGENPTDITDLDCWNTSPEIHSSELLMLIDSSDEDSLKSVYSFFNQNLSEDDIDSLAFSDVMESIITFHLLKTQVLIRLISLMENRDLIHLHFQ